MPSDGGAQAGPGKAAGSPLTVPSATALPDSVLSTRPLCCLLLGTWNLTQLNQWPPRAHFSRSQTSRPAMKEFCLAHPGCEIFHPVLRSVCRIYLESIHRQHFGSTPSCLLITFLFPVTSVLHTSQRDCLLKKEAGTCHFPAYRLPNPLRPECKEDLGGPIPSAQLHLPLLSADL